MMASSLSTERNKSTKNNKLLNETRGTTNQSSNYGDKRHAKHHSKIESSNSNKYAISNNNNNDKKKIKTDGNRNSKAVGGDGGGGDDGYKNKYLRQVKEASNYYNELTDANRAVEETKSKHWCHQCRTQAVFKYLSFCSLECQQKYLDAHENQCNGLIQLFQNDYGFNISIPIESEESNVKIRQKIVVRYEATFRRKIRRVSEMDATVYTLQEVIRNYSWQIIALPFYNVTRDGETVKNFGLSLDCTELLGSSEWCCSASAEFKIVSQKLGSTERFSRKIYHNFCPKESECGFSNFIDWSELFDERKGFVSNDEIIIEVTISID